MGKDSTIKLFWYQNFHKASYRQRDFFLRDSSREWEVVIDKFRQIKRFIAGNLWWQSEHTVKISLCQIQYIRPSFYSKFYFNMRSLTFLKGKVPLLWEMENLYLFFFQLKMANDCFCASYFSNDMDYFAFEPYVLWKGMEKRFLNEDSWKKILFYFFFLWKIFRK